jgi:hypothetical protein
VEKTYQPYFPKSNPAPRGSLKSSSSQTTLLPKLTKQNAQDLKDIASAFEVARKDVEKLLAGTLMSKANRSLEVKEKLFKAEKVLAAFKVEQSKAIKSYLKAAFGRQFSEDEIGQMLAEFQEGNFGKRDPPNSVSNLVWHTAMLISSLN